MHSENKQLKARIDALKKINKRIRYVKLAVILEILNDLMSNLYEL